MIQIVGHITNAVDCGCYEIEALPAEDPREQRDDCACEDQRAGERPQEATARVRIGADRTFVIRVAEDQLRKWFAGKNPWFKFRVSLNGEIRQTTSTPYQWMGGKRAKSVDIDLCAPQDQSHCAKVCGKITDCRGNPLGEMRVRAYDVDLYDATLLGAGETKFPSAAAGLEQQDGARKVGTLLGETRTNACGEYCFCYKAAAVSAGEIGTADIRVVVGPAAGRFRALQVSKIQFNAPANLTVNLAVPGSQLDGTGEFIEYHHKLVRLGCTTPAQRRSLTAEQLDFVSSEATIPINHLILLRQAYQIDAEFIQPLQNLPPHIVPQLLYGLLRTGVAGAFPDWARAYGRFQPDGIRAGTELGVRLADAIDRCIIDRGLGFLIGRMGNTAAAGQLIWFFSFIQALTTPLLPGRSSWRDLIAVAFPLPAGSTVLLQFGYLWLKFGIGDALWQGLQPLLSVPQIKTLRKLVQWAEISGYFAPAAALFFNNEPGLLVAVGSDTQWNAYFNTTSVNPPPAEITFPDYSAEVRERAMMLLGSATVTTWANGVTSADFPLLTLTATDARRSAERLNRLTTSAAFAARLAAAGFTSARDVAALSWQEFRARLNEPEGSVLALYTFTKAQETRAVAMASTLQLSRVLNAPFFNLAVPFLVPAQFGGTTLNGIADTLFGSGSACDCEGRPSVFSPAAYLHALRRFLAGVGPLTTGTAVLDARRPEMRGVQLSYTNSYTEMPAIDLNNEVLEDLVCPTLNPPVARIANRQTTLDAAELELAYEHENAGVYARFVEDTTLIRPWRFPFHLNHSKRRILLDAMGLSREQIVQFCTIAPTVQALSEAVLDLNQGQRTQLESTLQPLSSTFNATRLQLKNPLTMMDRAQLGFQDLYAITRLSAIYSDITPPTINPAVDGSGPTPCDPSEYQLNDALGSNTALTQTQADRIHRFVRLWRVLPWPMYVLDWAIGAFVARGEALLPLEWLGMAELIRRRLKLKPQEVIGFWGTLSTRRWEMPFVKSKAIPSPWDQVFRVQLADLTVAAAARAASISQQFAATLQGAAPFDEAIASMFYRYGKLAKAIPGVQPEDIWRYGTLKSVDVFASPENTWRAIHEMDVVRRSGTQLSAVLPFYMAQADPSIPVDRRNMLVVIETLNRNARVPTGVPFETALARFVPEATVTIVGAKLATYALTTTPSELAAVDSAIVELLAVPQLSVPALSVQTDAARKQRILTAISNAQWDRDIAGVLSQASGLDTATARLIADNVTTSSGLPLTAQFRLLAGDGGSWTNWPSIATAPSPNEQPEFLDHGVITVPSEALGMTGTLEVEFAAQFAAAAPGDYQFRAKVSYTAGPGATVEIDGVPLPPGGFILITTIAAPERAPATQPVLFNLKATTACSIQLEIVEPSGNTSPLPGIRLYSKPVGIGAMDGAAEALDLIALSGALAKQWKLNSTDLPALIRLRQGSANFPAFPPVGTPVTRRPLRVDDADGFSAWLQYARLVAALKMTRGEGRRILYETAILAQSGIATATDVWSGAAQALGLDVGFVSEAAAQLGLGVADFGNAVGWLELFNLSRALQENGVTATTFADWAKNFDGLTYADSGTVIASVDASARTKLSQSRSGGDTLRGAIDRIRALKRDALADYLLARPPVGFSWRTRTDISDYLLTDIEMEPCAQTSRIRFAIAAAQRLVTQTLAQAEPLSLTVDQEVEWRSIFRYRLWEVRQQILLYPENWLKFGRHLHKTPEFEELERSLLQGDLADEQAVEALTRYVEQLHVVGHLEIVGTCSQQEFDATGAVSLDLLHVVGRTPAEPRGYYYRRRVDGAYWTPWQKIELDIDCDQIVPVIHNRQLHVFWLAEESTTQTKPNVTKDDRQISIEDTYKTLRLAWSVLTTKGWRAKMTSKTSLSTRFGHFAANRFLEFGICNPYVEIHAWNQAVQDTGTYQLRPVLSDEGDIVIEIFAQVESTAVRKGELGIAEFAFQIRDTLNQVGGPGTAWFTQNIAVPAVTSFHTLWFQTDAGIYPNLALASPTVWGSPPIIGSNSVTVTTPDKQLLGTVRLTPDNLVEARSRSAQFQTPPQYLAAAERARTPPTVPSAVSRNGAFEFDDGSVELHAGGTFRSVLATAGTPVRVVVTRQEITPSERDPIFCRVKNRAFFAFKVPKTLPPAAIRLDDKRKWQATSAFQTVPREYVEHAAMHGYVVAPAQLGRAGHGAAMAVSFASTYLQLSIASGSAPWRFALAHHPQTIELLRAIKTGLDRLYNRDTQNDSRAATGSLSIPFDFDPDYDAISPWVDTDDLPKDALEFRPDQAYAVYNWELLCHAPMLLAQQSMRIGHYDASSRWIARVFNWRDPAVRDPAFGPPPHPENYWVFKPFVDFVAGDGVNDFANLDPGGGGDPYLRRVFRALVRQWRANPYNPHAVAAFRPQAYQMAAILLAVENLIAWGDSLFAAPSAELVEEAVRRYEEAERIIGRPPTSTGAIRYDAPALSVSALESGTGLADPALASVELENAMSLGDGPSPQVEEAFLPDLAIGYFCLPPNPKIKELRDRIQDRLFKAHHCLDLLGNPRKLPLYDPPISPDLLADAAMAGLNVSQAVMDAYTPRPHYRFRTLIGLAKGLVQQVSSLGAGLLSAMEKRDAESLSMLRSTHEVNVLERASAIRKLQVEDADAAIKVLEASLKTVEHRREFYTSRDFMNAEEITQIVLSVTSTVFRIISQGLNTAASAAGATPDFTVGAAGWAGSPVALATWGGTSLSRIPGGLAPAMGAVGDMLGTLSSVVGSMGSFRRRKEDWEFQAESAALEAKQIIAQMLGAQIRQTIATRDLENHEAQLDESREVLEFVRSKPTSVSLYEWLASDCGASCFRAFQLAHSMALQAQRAMHDELGTTQRFIGYSHWDGSRSGLQAGDRLMQDLHEMESFYHIQNARPVPKTLNVSLALVDPIALAKLKATGSCDFVLTETFWDRHAPTLYFRRFASVSVSVPAVVGPFSGVHGRLSITRASYRADPALPGTGSTSSGDELTDAYLRQQDGDDPRFVDQFARPGDFIEFSTGVRDTGMTTDEAREDRYRPFENLGVESSWHLSIPQRDNAFDLATIADVILHVEYTARDGGLQLATAARAAVASQASQEGVVLSMRHQFPGEWETFKSGQAVAVDIEPLLPVGGPPRDGRKFAYLNVAILVRAKTQPDATAATPRITLTLPQALFGATDPNAIDYDLPFATQGDGASRFAFKSQPIIDGTAVASDVLFEEVRSAKWAIEPLAGGDVDAADLEDLLISINWSLNGSA